MLRKLGRPDLVSVDSSEEMVLSGRKILFAFRERRKEGERGEKH